MRKKVIKKQVASLALTLTLASSTSFAFGMPVYAQEEVVNEDYIEQDVFDGQDNIAKDNLDNFNEDLIDGVNDLEEISDYSDDFVNSDNEFDDEIIEESNENLIDESNSVEEISTESEDLNYEENKIDGIDEKKSAVLSSASLLSDENDVEEHKVSVVTTKVDDDGVALKGAVLQILDLDGNVVDEWISDGTEHISMLPEGMYILHEKQAPKGYEKAEDKSFEVKVVINEINAGVDHDDSKDVCWHYGGVALYYVESKGHKEEVYCVNQGWDEPNNHLYDGLVLTEDNLRSFVPDADTTMSNKELYDKVLDIIYHRTKASELFPGLSEVEIRYVTEFALKNYTSTMVDDGALYRRYVYDPTNDRCHYEDLGNGNALGQLAKHWYYYHNREQLPSVYADLYNYLVSEGDSHPEDMYLYVYSTKQLTPEGENYQNLLGIKWFNPYDEDFSLDLICINEEYEPNIPPKEEDPKEPPKEYDKTPETSDNSNLDFAFGALGVSMLGMAGLARRRKI